MPLQPTTIITTTTLILTTNTTTRRTVSIKTAAIRESIVGPSAVQTS